MKRYTTIRNLAMIRNQLSEIEKNIRKSKNSKLIKSIEDVSNFTLECIHQDLNDDAIYEHIIDKLEHINKDIPDNSYFKDLREAFELNLHGEQYIGAKDEYAISINKISKKLSNLTQKNRGEMQTSDLWKSILHFYLDDKKYQHKKVNILFLLEN